MGLFEKLDAASVRYDELSHIISDPEVIKDINQWSKLTKEHSSLTEVVSEYGKYKELLKEEGDISSLLEAEEDEELISFYKSELEALAMKIDESKARLTEFILPKDPDDDKGVIMEIRPGTGGDEAALFSAVLLRMYRQYAENNKWKFSLLNSSFTDIGGVKEAVVEISGVNVYSRLKFESGVHRVQRVPVTESGGRVHTSTATVAVFPKAEEEVSDIEINPNDIRIDTYRSSGAGGQHVNMTDAAVRITHFPTGIVVACQDERSQIKNREKAFMILRSRLLAKLRSEQHEEFTENKRRLIGSGDRSEKIRTYNFPQGRVTDHRLSISMFDIDAFVNGDIDIITEALIQIYIQKCQYR